MKKIEEVMFYDTASCDSGSELLVANATRSEVESGVSLNISGSNESVDIYSVLFVSGEVDRGCEFSFTFTHDDIPPSDPVITTEFANNAQDSSVGGPSPAISTVPLEDLGLNGDEDVVLLCGDPSCSEILAEIPIDDIQNGASYDLDVSSSPTDTPISLYISTGDQAGNQSTPQDSGVTYTVDTTPPASATSVTLQHDGTSRTTDTTTDISFSVDETDTESLTILINSVEVYVLDPVSSPSVSVNDLALNLNESNIITLELLDEFGNASTQTLVTIEHTNEPPSEEPELLALDGSLVGDTNFNLQADMDTYTETLDLVVGHEDTTSSTFGPYTNAQITTGQSITLKQGDNELVFTLENDVGLTSQFTYNIQVETNPPEALVPTTATNALINDGSDPTSPSLSFEAHPRDITYTVLSHTASPQSGSESDLINGISVTLSPDQMNDIDIEITDSVGNSLTQTISVFQGYPKKGEIKATATGGSFTCGIGNTSGYVKCWGRNVFDSLGYGSVGAGFGQKLPENMPALDFGERAIDIFVGGFHACVLLESGNVKCWGRNIMGELGYGDKTDRTSTIATSLPNLSLPSGLEVVDMFLAANTTCALFSDETVRCWGRNFSSELTTDSSTTEIVQPPSTASVISDPSGIKKFSMSPRGTTCYANGNGELYCWGNNDSSQTGIVGAGDLVLTPTMVDMSGELVKEVSIGTDETCVITQGDSIKCWGDASYISGQHPSTDVLGDDEAPGSLTSISIPRGTPVSIKTQEGACVETNLSEVYCWGLNDLDSGVPMAYSDPTTTEVPLDSMNEFSNEPFFDYMSLSGGGSLQKRFHRATCAKSNRTGDVYCWGARALIYTLLATEMLLMTLRHQA